jgi:hypothetical protein
MRRLSMQTRILLQMQDFLETHRGGGELGT